MLEDDSGEEVALWRLTSLSRWSKVKFKTPCNFEESPYVTARVFSPLDMTCHLWKCRHHAHVYWNLMYPLSILKVVFLESNPLWFIETLISFIRAYVNCLSMPDLSNITPVLGEENFSLKIQFGIQRYLYYSYSCMFQVEICSQQLEICKSVCMFIVIAIVVETD
jgi:hypothetical protein